MSLRELSDEVSYDATTDSSSPQEEEDRSVLQNGLHEDCIKLNKKHLAFEHTKELESVLESIAEVLCKEK